MHKNRLKQILVYELTAQEIQSLQEIFPDYEIYEADVWQDILALPSNMVIINPDIVKAEELDCLLEFYQEIEPADTPLILTTEYDAFNHVKSVYTEMELFTSLDTGKEALLGYLHKSNKDYDFSRRLALIIRLQRLIIERPGLSTKALAELEEISPRSVKRYIETLNMCGAMIVYAKRGWHCNIAIWDVD